MQQVTVRVPASTSNLGPGYDCLGVALRLYNRVTVSRSFRPRGGAMAREAARKFFERAGVAPSPLACAIEGDVPISRGLGSSVTVRLGVILAANAIVGQPLSRQECFELCAHAEGHPDNAAPAAFGGFNIIGDAGRQQFAVSPELRFVLLVPPFEVRTADARHLLPKQINHHDAVTSCANACAITAAFASGKYEAMRGAFSDRLHQPYRQPLIPFFGAVVAAAESAGALGAFLSGSGSTIAALTIDHPEKVAHAMLEASGEKKARTIVTAADNRGARIVEKQ
ncbi:MAG: homoserine kinase [Verrucomicrobiota bacterium]|nr:homoserine kinase [Verrucomicrobiota bacterium]